jgi:hypothetical protein
MGTLQLRLSPANFVSTEPKATLAYTRRLYCFEYE